MMLVMCTVCVLYVVCMYVGSRCIIRPPPCQRVPFLMFWCSEALPLRFRCQPKSKVGKCCKARNFIDNTCCGSLFERAYSMPRGPYRVLQGSCSSLSCVLVALLSLCSLQLSHWREYDLDRVLRKAQQLYLVQKLEQARKTINSPDAGLATSKA